MEKMMNVLVADDEKNFCEIFKDLLVSEDCNVLTTTDRNEVLSKVLNYDIHVLLLDKRFPNDEDGMRVLREVKQTRPKVEVIMLTAHPDPDSNLESLREGASAYLLKTLDYAKIVETLKHLLEMIRLRHRNKLLMEKVEKQNEDLKKVRETLRGWNEELQQKLRNYEDFHWGLDKSLSTAEGPGNVELLSIAFAEELREQLFKAENRVSKSLMQNPSDLSVPLREAFSITQDLFDMTNIHCEILHRPSGKKSDVDLRSLVNKAYRVARTLAEFRSVKLSASIELPDHPIRIEAFPREVVEALVNLLRFAVAKIEMDKRFSDSALSMCLTSTPDASVLTIDFDSSECGEEVENIFRSEVSPAPGLRKEISLPLRMAKGTIEGNGGSITLSRPSNAQANRFTIRFPPPA